MEGASVLCISVAGLCSAPPAGADRCYAVTDLKGLHAGLDDGGKDRFAFMGVCKHVRDLVQQAGDETEGQTTLVALRTFLSAQAASVLQV